MPYVDVYDWVDYTYEANLGYDRIPLIRPNFVFFQFTGLRPDTPHWLFFDGVDVTKWVNTSYTLDDWNDELRDSEIREPGDRYTNATAFPNQYGGPTAASGSVTSSSTGTLEGLFYIQSNETTQFTRGTKILSAIDISVLKKEDCLSFAQAQYSAIGEYELYYEYTESEYEVVGQEWEEPPKPAVDNTSSNNNDDDSPTPIFSYYDTNTNTQYNYYSWDEPDDDDDDYTTNSLTTPSSGYSSSDWSAWSSAAG